MNKYVVILVAYNGSIDKIIKCKNDDQAIHDKMRELEEENGGADLVIVNYDEQAVISQTFVY